MIRGLRAVRGVKGSRRKCSHARVTNSSHRGPAPGALDLVAHGVNACFGAGLGRSPSFQTVGKVVVVVGVFLLLLLLLPQADTSSKRGPSTRAEDAFNAADLFRQVFNLQHADVEHARDVFEVVIAAQHREIVGDRVGRDNRVHRTRSTHLAAIPERLL